MMRTNLVSAAALILASMALPAESSSAPSTEISSAKDEAALTRLEFVKALQPFIQTWEAQALLKPLPGGSINVFIDLEGTEREFVLGLSDRYMLFTGAFEQAGLFGPDLPIRRREAALILSSLLDRTSITPTAAEERKTSPTFHDLGLETHQRLRPVLQAGILNGFPDGTFRPGRSLTRAQWDQTAKRLSEWGARTPAPMASPMRESGR